MRTRRNSALEVKDLGEHKGVASERGKVTVIFKKCINSGLWGGGDFCDGEGLGKAKSRGAVRGRTTSPSLS